MSSSIIDSANATTIPVSATRAVTHQPLHRAWLVAVALVAATTLGLTLAWQATRHGSVTDAASASGPSTQSPPVTPAAQSAPAASAGAGLLALAWDLTPPSQRESACGQFTSDPAAAWAAYSSGAETTSIATAAEFAAFLSVRC